MAAELATSASTFESDVLTSDLPVLVDFWAQWCRPCLAIGPHIEAIAADFAGKANVKKLDIDSEPDIASKYQVMSIPALLIFKNGQEVDRMIGAFPKEQIEAFLTKNL